MMTVQCQQPRNQFKYQKFKSKSVSDCDGLFTKPNTHNFDKFFHLKNCFFDWYELNDELEFLN